MKMRRYLLPLLCATTTLAGCAVWNPDYEPDPDSSLRQLLAQFDDLQGPIGPLERERLHNALVRLASYPFDPRAWSLEPGSPDLLFGSFLWGRTGGGEGDGDEEGDE